MICKSCGNTIDDNARFCTHCGVMLEANQAPAAHPQSDPVTPPEDPAFSRPTPVADPTPPVYRAEEAAADRSGLSYAEFYELAVSRKSKSWVRWMTIVCYISAAAALVLCFTGNYFGLISAAVLLLSAVMLNSSKKRTWAMIPTVYGGFLSVFDLITVSIPTGVAALLLGIRTAKILKKTEKAYEEYQATGVLPEKKI